MKKRYHLRSDGEIAESSVLERSGCVVLLLASVLIAIIGIHKLMQVIVKIF